jgi:hypothetical protein
MMPLVPTNVVEDARTTQPIREAYGHPLMWAVIASSVPEAVTSEPGLMATCRAGANDNRRQL